MYLSLLPHKITLSAQWACERRAGFVPGTLKGRKEKEIAKEELEETADESE